MRELSLEWRELSHASLIQSFYKMIETDIALSVDATVSD